MPVRQLPCPTHESDGYDKKIDYERKDKTLNAFGEVSDEDANWRPVASVYANVKTGSGSDVYRARKIHSETTALVTIPWNSTTREFDSSGRFRINGSTYDILFAVNVDENNLKMEFGCKRTEE